MPKLPGLRRCREAYPLSQTELAARSGVPQPTISKLECGRGAQVATVRRLAAALEVEPRALFDGGPRP